MITINVMGGLGNQLFQIFTLLSTSIETKQVFFFEKILTSSRADRPFYWNSFLSRLSIFMKENIAINGVFNEPHFHHVDITKLNFRHDMNVKLIGYYQSYKYFDKNKALITRMIQVQEQRHKMKEKSFFKNIDFTNTVSLHFRIGDYAKLQQHHPVMETSYYIKALNNMIKDTEKDDWKILYFYEKQDEHIVMEKISEIKENHPSLQFFPIDHELKDWEQLLCMSLCSHNIIANSTFSWWGAYLNDNENRVYYPNKWFGEAQGNKKVDDLFLPSWKKISNINFDDIYCLHYLLPENKLLKIDSIKQYYEQIKGKSIITSTNHLLIKIEDSIHYQVISGKLSFYVYDTYIRQTNQKEHSIETFKSLINNFDISKIDNILLHNVFHDNKKYKVIKDGLHRSSIVKYYGYDIQPNIIKMT